MSRRAQPLFCAKHAVLVLLAHAPQIVKEVQNGRGFKLMAKLKPWAPPSTTGPAIGSGGRGLADSDELKLLVVQAMYVAWEQTKDENDEKSYLKKVRDYACVCVSWGNALCCVLCGPRLQRVAPHTGLEPLCTLNFGI